MVLEKLLSMRSVSMCKMVLRNQFHRTVIITDSKFSLMYSQKLAWRIQRTRITFYFYSRYNISKSVFESWRCIYREVKLAWNLSNPWFSMPPQTLIYFKISVLKIFTINFSRILEPSLSKRCRLVMNFLMTWCSIRRNINSLQPNFPF